MHPQAPVHEEAARQLPVAIATSDASLLEWFSDSFDAAIVSLEDTLCAPERLWCRVILLDARAKHCHLQAARLAINAAVAVVVLVRPDNTSEAMRYLDVGVADVLRSTMSTSEMHARLRAAARYTSNFQDDWVTSGGLAVSLQRGEVRRDGEMVHLTPTEFRVLATLLMGGSETVSHQTIMARVWGQELLTARNYLQVYIRQLREKLEVNASAPHFILTVPGEGYRLMMQTGSAGMRQQRGA